MKRFGNIVEVVAARDYTEEINISKKIYSVEMEMKEIQF